MHGHHRALCSPVNGHLGWKPTVWVHWVCAHSGWYMEEYRNLYMFSSVPTEQQHRRFKVDLRHACHAFKRTRPRQGASALRHVLALHSIDTDLQLRAARRPCLSP